MEYDLTIKKNGVIIHATTWMKLKNIKLKKKSQSQKHTYCVLYLQDISRTGKFIETAQ